MCNLLLNIRGCFHILWHRALFCRGCRDMDRWWRHNRGRPQCQHYRDDTGVHCSTSEHETYDPRTLR